MDDLLADCSTIVGGQGRMEIVLEHARDLLVSVCHLGFARTTWFSGPSLQFLHVCADARCLVVRPAILSIQQLLHACPLDAQIGAWIGYVSRLLSGIGDPVVTIGSASQLEVVSRVRTPVMLADAAV